MAKFTEIFEDVTKKGVKIPSNLYLDTGLYPIIDQGQSAIAGYTNKADGLFFDVPAIIFGDHTRIFKYVEKPCFLGADGVKLLKAKKPNANHKYLYYALCNADIPNTGYNRHFKWLKEVDIPEYSEEEQEDIVLKLDKISHLIALRKRQLSKLDELVKSRFVEMFGSCPANTPIMECGKVFTGSTPPMKEEAYYQQADFCFVKPSDLSYDVRKFSDSECHLSHKAETVARMFNPGSVLVTCIGATIGKMGVAQVRGSCNQQINFIEPFDNVDSLYLAYAIQSRHKELVALANSTAVPIINKSEFCKFRIPFPPLALQREFAAFVEKVDKLEFKAKASLEKLETLKKAMMQKYFN